MSQPRLAVILSAVAVFLAGLAVTLQLTVDQTNDSSGHKTTQITFKVNGQKGDGQPTKTLTVPAPAVVQAHAVVDKQLRDETPLLAQKVAPGELTAAQAAAARIRATQPPLPTAGASQGFIGCRTEFVRNVSSRHGTRPQLQVLHYTVSPNRLGWSDVESVVHLFNTTAAQASSNFVIDGEGNCAYIVPIEEKAWTQAAANPYSVSYEIIDMGNESIYLQPAGLAKLRSVMEQVSARTGIPMRTGKVNGCVPVVTGIVQHADFGYCGGGHHDIGPFNFASVVKQLAVKQPVARAVRWLAHRKAIHAEYAKKCKHAYQRRVRPVTCAKLRSDARKLDKLLARPA